MRVPQEIDFLAERGLFFSETISFVGEDLTAATAMKLYMKVKRDAPDPPIIGLTLKTDDTEGVRLMYAGTATVGTHITNGRLSSEIYDYVNPATGNKYASGDSVVLSQIRILAYMDSRVPIAGNSETPGERGDDVVLYYDLVINRPSIITEKWLIGKFTVRGSVSI